MELRHLRYFLAVVETGSTVRAAEQALVAQPSLSRQLRRLEGELGVHLFHRSGQGTRLRLSPAGEELVPIARDLLARADAARDAMAAFATGHAGRITIAAPGTTISDVVAPFIAGTSADDPVITVQEELPSEVYPALRTGADLAISSAPPPRGLAHAPLARLPVHAYVPPVHPWAQRATLTLAELCAEPLLLLTAEHGTRRLLDQAVVAADLSYDIAFETPTPQVAQALAAAGHGVAVVSDDPRYGLRPISITTADGPLRIAMYAAWDTTHYAAGTVRRLTQRLSAFCLELYGPAAMPPPDAGSRDRRPDPAAPGPSGGSGDRVARTSPSTPRGAPSRR